MICLRRISAIGLLLAWTAGSAEAQYFGRNKVEYQDFEFRILETEHFDIYHYGREEAAARLAARLAERWYARLSRFLDHELTERQPLVLYGSQPEFGQTNVVSGLVSETVGGVTESARRRIVMPFAPTLAETNRVLGHELVHAFQFDIARRQGDSLNQPLWFVEGMAEYLARGRSDAEARLWLRDAVTNKRVPERQSDAARRLSPYQYGHAFWAYLAERFGDDVVNRALKPGKNRQLKARMKYATGVELDALFAEWRASVQSMDGAKTGGARNTDSMRLFQAGASGTVQLGPALSPDGRYAVFFSERDQFALDLFLVEVKSGTIVRRLATTTASARFDSLQPLRSAGAWSADGERFAFAAIRQGHPALVLLDIRNEHADREIDIPELGQILTVAWSPDGRSLALSALAGGFSDLYLYDVAGGRLQQLTDDAYADLHPAWSPDGQEIVFASDRFSSDLAGLQFGPSELAIIDVDSRGVRPIPIPLRNASLINPQWSADGQQLYFVANPDGVSNVFHLDLAGGVLHQVTDVATGVTGLTPTSPSLSLATKADVLAFTVYRNGTYRLAILDGQAALLGEKVIEPASLVNAAAVDVAPAPAVAEDGLLAQLLRDSVTGLPDQSPLGVRSYSPRLGLERIGQPYLSSGGGALGSFVRAGGSMLFGDMLGGRRLGTAIQISNRMRNLAFETRFLNQEHRWNWGGVAELEPALRRYRFSSIVDHQGQPALMKQVDYLQRVQLRVAGLLAYPLNRSLRVELTGGVRYERYHRDMRSRISSVETGLILDDARLALSGGAPMTVAELGTALVGDTTVFGPTGPLLGSRFRLEVTPAVGGLTYTSVLMDYRRYVMPVRPYTLAMRLLHSGRYGRDSEDSRLLPSFLGSRSFVRGHGWDARDCRPEPGSACGGELLGNRLLVANLELRVPLWGVPSRQIKYGPLPVDAFVFADGGLVWSRHLGMSGDAPVETSLSVAPLQRGLIGSIGFGIRTNAGGLPFEVSAVRALDYSTPGWAMDFGFRTAF